jgi:hypothetical protein
MNSSERNDDYKLAVMLTQKLAVGRGVLGNSGYMSGYSGHRCPETPDQ